ncbi:MAG TPA: hypothetical protein VHP37_15220 [Burkholderiales bacterium]|nr:hypothetical protein [Burkholderiales bacterium]
MKDRLTIYGHEKAGSARLQTDEPRRQSIGTSWPAANSLCSMSKAGRFGSV